MKKQQTTHTPKYTCCTPRQKFLGIIALGGLFACGLMVGVAINGRSQGSHQINTEAEYTFDQCQNINMQIAQMRDDCNTDDCIKKLNDLNTVFAKNCAGRSFKVDDSKSEPAPQRENTADKETCELIEDMLLNELRPEDSMEIYHHNCNIQIYYALTTDGCSANKEKYQNMISRESAIIDALKKRPEYAYEHPEPEKKTCIVIEGALGSQLYNCDNSRHICSADERIQNAKIYAQLAERGCALNAARYTELAARELEIARALRDDKFDERETTEVVETYKRLEMKQQATEVLNKVQKLTDPAIDFILQIQKIIEE